jgi:hypothetical protein
MRGGIPNYSPPPFCNVGNFILFCNFKQTNFQNKLQTVLMYINTYITSDASSLYFFTWDACYFTCFICDFMITSGTLARTNQDWPVRPIAVPAQRITCPPLLCQHAGIPSVHEIPGPQVGRHCRFLRVDENVSSMSESSWYDLRKQVEFW